MPWMSPDSKSSRTDSAYQDAGLTTLTAPIGGQAFDGLPGFDMSTHDGMLAFMGSGVLPPSVDPSQANEHVMMPPPKYTLEMSSTQMPLLVPVEASSDPLQSSNIYLALHETVASNNLMQPPTIPSTPSEPTRKRRKVQVSESPERPHRPSIPFRTSELLQQSVEGGPTAGPGRPLIPRRFPEAHLMHLQQANDPASMPSIYDPSQQLQMHPTSTQVRMESSNFQGPHVSASEPPPTPTGKKQSRSSSRSSQSPQAGHRVLQQQQPPANSDLGQTTYLIAPDLGMIRSP